MRFYENNQSESGICGHFTLDALLWLKGTVEQVEAGRTSASCPGCQLPGVGTEARTQGGPARRRGC